MTDVDAVVGCYIDMWNETDAERRREAIAATWTGEAAYVDPLTAAEGTDAIDGMIAAVQERFPGHRFELAGAPEAHNGRVRFAWTLVGPEGAVAAGTDFGVLADDGRLRTVTGFLDAVA